MADAAVKDRQRPAQACVLLPGLTALRCSPFFQAWAEGLQERGKCKMTVICAGMRKLVHLAYGVLKTGQPFDPEWAKAA